MLTQAEVRTREQITERDAWINQCVEAGLCHVCEQPVADGATSHEPTGAECQQSALEETDQVDGGLSAVAVSADKRPRMARVSGAQLVHFVIPATDTALCGHKPRNSRLMRRRGKWLFWKLDDVVPGHMEICGRCKALAQTDNQPAE